MHIVGVIIRYLFGLGYLVGGLGLLAVGGLALWAKNWKVGGVSSLLGLIALLGSYESFTYASPFLFWLILIFFLLLAGAAFLYVTEPDLGIIDRFKSPQRLLKEGKKEKAAIKFKRCGAYRDAGKLYEELDWLASAALCYEEAGEWEKVAQLYLQMGEKEGEDGEYYLRKAREIFEEKLQDFERAAQVLERLAELEGWYWEDAAKNWEKVGNKKAAKRCWEKALKYYRERVKEDDRVFLSDVADILERLGKKDEAVKVYQEFLEYCREMVEKEERGWLRHVVETLYAMARISGNEEFKKEGDKALEEYKAYLDEVIKSEEYKEELLNEVKRWLTQRVDRRP